MRKALGLVLAGVGAVTLTSAAFAASRDNHVMTVPLPDGAVATINYVGNVAPKVTVAPAPISQMFAPFSLFDRSAFDMRRQIDAMIRQIDRVATQPMAGAPGLSVASYGNSPAGSTSVTIVTTSNGSQTCTRRTEVWSEGPGKAPKVASSLSGDCGAASSAPKTNPA